jgi:hypothetical protein
MGGVKDFVTNTDPIVPVADYKKDAVAKTPREIIADRDRERLKAQKLKQ